MLKITYNIGIYNPIAERLKATNTLNIISTLKTTSTKTGYVIQGLVRQNSDLNIATNYGYIGEDYYVKTGLTSEYSLKESQTYYTDPEEVLACDGMLYKDISSKYKNSFNKAILTSDKSKRVYSTLHVFTDVGDAIFFQIEDGRLQIVSVNFQPPTNIVSANEDVSGLYYVVVNKSLKISTDEYMYLPYDELNTLPEGFCKLQTSLLSTPKTYISKIENNSYLFQVNNAYNMYTNYPLYIDGVLSTNYLTEKNETIYLQPLKNETIFFNTVSLGILNDSTTFNNNIIALYELSDTNTATPYLIFISDGIMTVEDEYRIDSQNLYRLDILQSDEEFKKKYIIKQYRIEVVLSNGEIYDVYDTELYKYLEQNLSDFNKKIVVNGN